MTQPMPLLTGGIDGSTAEAKTGGTMKTNQDDDDDLALTKRSLTAANEILQARDPYGSEPLDHVFIGLLLAEAYERGWHDRGNHQ